MKLLINHEEKVVTLLDEKVKVGELVNELMSLGERFSDYRIEKPLDIND